MTDPSAAEVHFKTLTGKALFHARLIVILVAHALNIHGLLKDFAFPRLEERTPF